MEKIMSRTEHAYYENRLKSEERLARAASCTASKIVHQKMASHYREIIGGSIDGAARSF